MKLDMLPRPLRIRRKLRLSYLGTRFACSLGSVAVIIFLICKVTLGGGIPASNVKPTASYGKEYTIASNEDYVLKLQPDEWGKLNLQERMDVLQCICNIEGNYLGLNKGIKVRTSEMGKYLGGTYDDIDSTVSIDLGEVMSDNPTDALNTICHELYHAASYRFVEIYRSLSEDDKKLYFLRDAATFAEEFENYKSAPEIPENDMSGYSEYRDQLCERKARLYAAESVWDYYEQINRILAASNESDIINP